MQTMITSATATEVQNNFGRYLQYAMDKGQVIILKNGKRVARIISEDASVSFLTDSLRGVLKHQYTEEEVKAARTEKYEAEE